MSNARTGAHFKARSKQWLQKAGFQVFDMELLRVIYTPMGMVPTKRDQLGADVGYLDIAKDRVALVQVKGGAVPLQALVTSATKTFADYRFPRRAVRLELHVWRRLARAPEVIVISHASLDRYRDRYRANAPAQPRR